MFNKLVNFWRDKKENLQDEAFLLARLDRTRLPRHVAIIMDGNGRWAARRGMPRSFGHRAGVESLREVVRVASELGIGFLTVYAFSTENWKRPQEEVNILMDLLVEYLHKELEELHSNNVNIRAIGKVEDLPLSARDAVAMASEKTRNNTGLILNVALNYGGRTELVEAIKSIGLDVARGIIDPEKIDQNTIAGRLYTAGQPDPDLLIRPSGDYRVSNFLLWQLAYTEFWLTEAMWPEFRRIHFLQALVDFQNRKRRFGGLIE